MKRRLTPAGLFALLGAVVLAGAAVLAQTPSQITPTFKAEVEYVEVDALVTNQQGDLVRDLKKEDFEVFEDGKKQTVTDFMFVDLPVERAVRPLFADRPIEPDVQSNERPFDGRAYVVLLDDYHIGAVRSPQVRRVMRQFIERNLGANDLMAIVFTGGRAADSQEFTSNKRLLLAAVDKFIGQKLDSVTVSRNNEFSRQAFGGIVDGRVNDPDEFQRAAWARSTLTSLEKISTWFGGVRGRKKSLLFVSEGIDYNLDEVIRAFDQPSSRATDIMQDIRDAISATTRANVSIYSIDPRGAATDDDTIGISSFADSSDPTQGISSASMRNEVRMAQDSLRSLAEETGGFAVLNRNDFSTAFDRIVRDNSSYYVLAYYPGQDKRPGRFHKIEVKVARPGLTVRARQGYLTPRNRPAQQNTKASTIPKELLDAFNSPIQVSGVAMQLFAAPFKGPQPNASVLVGLEIRGRDLSLAPNSKVEFTMMAIDAKGKTYGGRNDSLTLNLRPETKARVEQSGLRVFNRIELPPGRYQLRMAVRDAGNAAVGSVLHDLEVPDFYKQNLVLSGLTLTSPGTSGMLVPKADDAMKDVLPAPPVASRRFAQNDEIAIFAEVYDNGSTAPHKVNIVTSVITDDGRVLYKTDDARDSSELGGAKGGYGYTTRVPLKDIPSGLYVLSVEARSSLNVNSPVTRQIQITVEPRR